MPLNSIVDPGAPTRAQRSGRSDVIVYDFRRPTKLSRDSIRLLQVTFETFSRRLTTLLTSGLRQVCHIAPTDISQQSYEEYISSRPTETLIVPVSMPQLPGTAVLEFSLPVALAAVDHMLGGPGAEQPTRTLTDIETTLIRGLIDQMLGVLEYSLEPLVPVKPSPGMIEYNPQFVQIVSATDAVLVALFDMTIGTQTCEMSLCIPLAPLLPRLMAQRGGDDPDQQSDHANDVDILKERLRQRLGDTPLDVSVEFSPTRLSPSQILTASVGDVIPLNHRIGRPLAVRVGGVTFAQAVAGRSGSRLAALITDSTQEQA